MANSTEDLEFNQFFQALQSRFSSQYDHAQQNCWLVCIPHSSSLHRCTINRQFIDAHLLEPSELLRDVYKSSGSSRLGWRLSDGALHCALPGNKSCDYSVRVLAEELAYNRALKQFKMFIVEKPLDPNYKGSSSSAEGNSGGVGGLQDSLKRKKTYREHMEFLESFQNCKEGLEELEIQIRLFNQNYLVVQVERLLLDTATKLEGIARQGNNSFIEANKSDPKFQDRRILDACWLSIEGYLMHHVHSKVFPAVCAVHAKYDSAFSERCCALRGRLTPSVAGVSQDYECQYPSTLSHLKDLDSLQSPLEMLYSVQDAMDSIMLDVKANFTRCLRIGEPVALASDDLISVVATIITHLDCKCFLSVLYYMENFHWSFSDMDQLSYILVTLRAAVEFLRGPDVNKWLPSKPPVKSFPPTSNSSEGSSSPNFSLSNSEESSSSSSGPTSTLSQALMARLGKTEMDKKPSKPHPPQERKDEGLGPFLSRLLEDDSVVTSSDYYNELN